MNRLSKPQKDKVSQFRGITGASEKVALECLKASNWGVEAGIDHFYSSGLQATTTHLDSRAVEALFQKYKASDEEVIQAEGVGRFCEDLEVDPADVVMLIISYHMNAALMCEFSKEEWSTGMLKMGCDSIDKLKRKLPELRAELRNPDRFRDIYNYAYLFSRERGQKCVQLDVAVGMWQLLFAGEQAWPLVDVWCEFLQKHHNRAISKDTWAQLLDFARTVKPDFSNFDDNSAWPYLLDEFVEYAKAKRSEA